MAFLSPSNQMATMLPVSTTVTHESNIWSYKLFSEETQWATAASLRLPGVVQVSLVAQQQSGEVGRQLQLAQFVQ